MNGRDDPIRFAERLLALLEEGSFTATYKFAVLLGLMDLCLEHSNRFGEPAPMVTTRQLAEKVIDLYWSHTTPFESHDGEVLRQNARRQLQTLVFDYGRIVHRDQRALERAVEAQATAVEARLAKAPPDSPRILQSSDYDSGKGLPDGNTEDLFNPFFTTKIKGSGVGLALARQFIEAADGTLRIENRSSGGVRAIMELPREKT